MEAIAYHNIKVLGVDFHKILGLEIRHFINEHATAVLTAELEPDIARDLVKRADERQAVRIVTSAAGQPETLFLGILSDVVVDLAGEYVLVTATLKSLSALVDHARNNRSFQNTNETHSEVIKSVLQEALDLDMQTTDKPIGHIIVQCNETDWEFAMRMASDLQAPLVASIKQKVLTVGIPQGKQTYHLTDYESSFFTGKFGAGAVPARDSLGVSIKTMQYLYIGDRVAVNGEQRVKGITASLQSGILETMVYLSPPMGFKQQPIVNTQISGKMYLGKVKAVQLDQVKVHLVDIDSEFSEENCNVWLPYSTAYSSSDGSGFYCMPAVEDKVRVFFPGSDEGQAFAASSVSQNPGARVTDKQWTGPNGKEILLTDEGIFITTNANDNKIFINLTDEKGITICSNKNINICAKKNLSLISNDSICITAQNDILISSAEAYIDITPQEIEIAADNVIIK